jgi:hypothetical protein
MPFKPGYPNGVYWKPTGGSAFTQIVSFRHDHNESDEGHDVTSSSSNGIQEVIATILRGDGTLSGHLDNDLYPWAIGLVSQASGQLKMEYGDQDPFFLPVYISRLHVTNETAAGTDFDVSFKMNGLAGTYSRPS